MGCLEFKEALFAMVVKLGSLNAISNYYLLYCNFMYSFKDCHSKGLPHGLFFL